jgi:dihydroorotate dehydrogenase electron transfer subunit
MGNPTITSSPARIERREQVTPLHVLLRLHAPEIAASAQAGQFVHLRASEACDPLLRRPFSLMQVEPATGLIDLLVQVVGRGSQLVAEGVVGQTFDLLGPLGTPWPLPPLGAPVILVAGGVGVAPLIFLADRIASGPEPHAITGLFGARTEDLLCCWMELAARCGEFQAVTEDGSAGRQGLVTEALGEFLTPHVFHAVPPVVYSCGPLPMLAAVAGLCAEAGAECYVSLERWMGCGVGACLGCVVPSLTPTRYVRVCKDGPVFAAADLDWQAMPA